MAVQRIPLAAPVGEREPGVAKDPLLVNCFKETVQEAGKTTTYVTKRWGLKTGVATATGEGRGIYTWKGNVYVIVGNTLYKDGVANGTTLDTSTGRIYFDEAADGSGLIVFHDGANLYTYDTTDVLVKQTDLDIPTNIQAGILILDQYCFLMDQNGALHSSAVGDVTTWNADVITAETMADAGVGIARYINYLVAFGVKTIEFFYDAANASGSPLSRFEGMATMVGCASGGSIVLADQRLLFVGESQHGGRFVGLMEGGFEIKRISTNAIDELLDKEGSNITNAYAYHVRKGGKNLYVLNLPTTAKRTFVADLDEKEWYEWTSDASGTEGIFVGIGSTNMNGIVYVLDMATGKYHEIDPATYQDNTATAETIKTEIRSKKWDGANTQNKFCSRLTVIGDQTPNSATMNVAWSDDDYKTWSTNRPIEMNTSQTWLTRLGMFKRRAFRLQFQNNEPMRIEALELNIDQGHYARSG